MVQLDRHVHHEAQIVGRSEPALEDVSGRDDRAFGRRGRHIFEGILASGANTRITHAPSISIFVPTPDLDRELPAGDHWHTDELRNAADVHADRVVDRGLQAQDLTHLQRQHPT